VLLHLGHTEEAKKELGVAVRIEHGSEREKQMEPVPSPELLQDPQ
jgi:hypothetical protein